MSPEEVVRAVLLTMNPVTTLVGDRIRTFIIGEHELTFPVIRLQSFAGRRPMHMRGAVMVRTATVQVDSIVMMGSDIDFFAQARALDETVHGPGDGSGLCGYTGSIGSPPVMVYSIVPVRLAQGAIDPEERQQFKMMSDYEVMYSG